MTKSTILQLRLHNTGLCDSRFTSPAEAVSHLGGVQAQDLPAAKWALGLRVRDSTVQTIEAELNAGKILRTHVLRPTWHFVSPQDIRWMLQLTAPRIKKVLNSYNLKLGLDSRLLTKSNRIIVKGLQKNSPLTRKDLKAVLTKAGIETDVQRLAHIVVWAELDGLICSGPQQGKQNTYTLLEARVPEAKQIDRYEALSKLARTYFRSHGPAQLKDFSWWSGLAAKDAQSALESVRKELEQWVQDGKTYWFPPAEICTARSNASSAFLLSIYDEYTIAYRDRSDLSEAREIERMIAWGNALTSVLISNYKVAGAWKKKINKNKLEVFLTLFRSLNKREQNSLKSHVSHYAKFLGVNDSYFSVRA